MSKVDFFIAGVQKGGTTALDRILRRHPQIQMAATKEVHHFDDEESVDWADPSHDRLHAEFDWTVDGVLRGEATPIYTYWPRALERIRAYNPHARLIVGLRHPVHRAYSHWKMETSRGYDDVSFSEALSPAGRARAQQAPDGVHRVYSYIERSLYAGQIERLLTHFPRRQAFFFRTDDLWRGPETLAAIQAFLEISPETIVERGAEYIVPVSTAHLGELPRQYLRAETERFRSDIETTARLTGLDLTDWLDESYREPMAAA